jgi:hypothetical protein
MTKWKLPTCSGFTTFTACGYDYDCLAVHGESCEYCLCNWFETGGTINPETGVKHKYKTCVKRYGEPHFNKEK